MKRRDLLAGLAATGAASLTGNSLAKPHKAQAVPPPPSMRPPVSERKFVSPAVEAVITRMRGVIKDQRLLALFENCYPNTLDTTVEMGEVDGKPDAFVITGDIEALWLRDSSAQVWPYLALAKNDEALTILFHGLIQRQARCILIDPYANAFMKDAKATTNLSWAQTDMTDMKPGVAERKWEIDSLCYPVRLAHGYLKATGDTTPFDATWREAMRTVLRTFTEQQRKTDNGPYHFQRTAEVPSETLALKGYGNPTRRVGLIHSGFRPSDDACIYNFLIPSNHFAVVSLRQLAEMAPQTGLEPAFAEACLAMATEVSAALDAYGQMTVQGETVWAYEVDGFGNALFMDDANVPSLLGLPYLGAVAADDPIYAATRKAVWSQRNPYFFTGSAGEGIGGPHEGMRNIWPMSLMMRILTSDNDTEIAAALDILATTDAGTGFMHETFDQDDPKQFLRPWFAWANSLFGETILDSYVRKPHLIL